jgi:type I restriction enzyme S subunit
MARENTKTGGKPATEAIVPGDVCISIGKPPRTPPLGYDWQPLASVARLETGHTPSRKNPDYWGGDVPWIGIRDATGNHGRVIEATNENTNTLGIANSSARVLPAGTVCLSRTASVGYVVVMGRPMATSQDFVNWVCTDALNPHFLKYALLSEQRALRMFAVGSVHSTIYFPEVKAFHLCMPSREVQDAIAATLGALDDKIELNRKMNATLEAMARALFRDWFVDFGPTRAKMEGQTPYLAPDLWSLFPDRLDDEGKPEGWEIFALGQIADHHTKSVTPAKMADGEVEHFSLPAFDKGQIPAIDLGATIKSNKTLVPAEAVLLSKLNPEIPRIWMPESQGRLLQVTSTEFLAYTAKGGAGRNFLFCLFSDQGFREMLHGMVTGTSKSHQRISPPSLLGRDVVVGATQMFVVFEKLVAPLLERVRANRAESRTLAQTRDLLLPRLMSGELRVAGAERLVGEVA